MFEVLLHQISHPVCAIRDVNACMFESDFNIYLTVDIIATAL